MQVKCVICDEIESLEDDCLQAKRLRNRKRRMYLCQSCHDRIESKTIARHKTNKFKLHHEKKQSQDLI